jgi:preprotein translocase subunit SecG
VLWIAEVVFSVAILVSILLQSGRSAGLSGAISGAAETFLGGRRQGLDEVLARVTAVLGVLFLGCTLLLAGLFK